MRVKNNRGRDGRRVEILTLYNLGIDLMSDRVSYMQEKIKSS